jgi:hypothetical protein
MTTHNLLLGVLMQVLGHRLDVIRVDDLDLWPDLLGPVEAVLHWVHQVNLLDFENFQAPLDEVQPDWAGTPDAHHLLRAVAFVHIKHFASVVGCAADVGEVERLE